jgi:catechol 2,3-dioxygenase-like lactoylglutathione lyase family enzyme
MFARVTLRASDRDASERFYSTVLPSLGIEPTHRGDGFARWDDFSLTRGGAVTRGLHIAFVAPSPAHVDAFWRAGTEAGYRDDGAPGPRPQYRDDYYGAFLLDPDGNSAEAVHHGALRRGGGVDHLWIRVGDLDASRDFYETVAPYARFRLKHAELAAPRRAQFAAESGSFSLVDGPPTENLHIAFPAADEAAVTAFRRTAATAAGHRDDGELSEQPGDDAASVLDPDATAFR